MTFDPIVLDRAMEEIETLAGSIKQLETEAAGSNDPAVHVPVITALEAEWDVASSFWLWSGRSSAFK